jgi:Mrp family chromosome partitioning ATPase
MKEQFVLWRTEKSLLTEAYNTLRTNISFSLAKDNIKTLMFTSSGPEEGKTFSIVNYALSVAESRKQVLLVESDLRRPSLHKMFGLERGEGLTDVLLDSISWKNAVKGTSDLIMGGFKLDNLLKLPGIENLKIMTCGSASVNPLELLNSKSLADLLVELRSNFDVVVFDCPPVLLFADATILATKVDAVVVVYQSGRTSRVALKRAKTQLENVKANMLGIVLNDVRIEMLSHYRNYYYSDRYYRKDNKT